MRRLAAAPLAASLLLLAACVPDLDTNESVLDVSRVLAVSADPAEPAPGEPVTWTALLAAPEGDPQELRWARCDARLAATDPGPISSRCLQGDPDALVELGQGLQLTSALPDDACARFGPDPPPPEPGQTPARPAAPDLTGGYRYPLLLEDLTSGVQTTLEQRVRCGLAAASPEDAARFRRDYLPNTTPRLDALEIRDLDTRDLLRDDPSGGTLPLRPGQRLAFTARWAACPHEPAPCTGAETFLRFNPTRRAFDLPRESLRLAWIATRPGWALERTGVASEHDAIESANTFHVPERAQGPITLWIILRDTRGAASWATLRLE